LNAGPGSTGGFFVNRKHHDGIAARKSNILAGWWGVDLRSRFLMNHEFDAYRGARAFQQSCTSVFNTCGLIASMETFRKVDIEAGLGRSRQLTRFFRKLLRSSPEIAVKIVTPPESGAQLSLLFETQSAAVQVFQHLSSFGVISDRREPSIIRLTFTGLYNSHEDVYLTFLALKQFFTKK
jgi:kynureninase